MEYIIEVKNLTKSYGKKKRFKEVLKGVNLTVKKGQIFALLGSNGAGKTTIIKILSTLSKFDSGKVKICNLDLEKDSKKIRQLISLTGQYAAVDEMLTGLENMILVARLRHLKNYHQRIMHLLSILELDQCQNQLVKTYSGGMKRKVDIAMSLLGDPSIIFLDEPTVGLDPQSRKNLWKLIENLKKEGITIILTTQYLEEAECLADYVAVLDEGVIVTSGTPAELKQALKDVETLNYETDMPTLEDVFLAIINKGEKK